MKVLIAVDYNPASEVVVNKGYELAQKLGAQVELLHVLADIRYYGVQYPTFMGYNGFEDLEMEMDTREYLQKVADDFIKNAARHLNDDTVTTRVENGETSMAILEYLKKSKPDMLVMGTHSHSTLEKIFVGTTASKILEKTEVPVYMVPIKRD